MKTETGVLTAKAILKMASTIKKMSHSKWMDLPFHCEKYPKCKNTKDIHIHLQSRPIKERPMTKGEKENV